MRGLAILGSTGSVGVQTLSVVREFHDRLKVVGLAAKRSVGLLEEQIREFSPKIFHCESLPNYNGSKLSSSSIPCSVDEMVSHPDVDMVVSAVVGDVGLRSTILAIQLGKNVALANKESIVIGGQLVSELLKTSDGEILPVDSEPNAIWQCMRGEDKKVSKLIITASGGAFRNYKKSDLSDVTPEEALKHPTWNMGPKITIDSATLMNKAFEVIEAHWLFGVPWENIEVVIHPQSMIHSMVEFVDGSVKAQIGPPDMRAPIQYSLLYPDRIANNSLDRFDPVGTGCLSFEELNQDLYPCFDLALKIAKLGGTWPAALSGADEMAVELFLSRRIRFDEIYSIIDEALKSHDPVLDPDIEDILSASNWAKNQVKSLAEV